jgi:ABC-type transport system involved in multi-copper enzyme maturation permease subunit
MSVLPIVNRELRVAARKRSTFWVRVVSASAAVILAVGCLLLWRSLGASSAQMGSTLFYALSWTCLAAALGAGLFFTSDCLSEEKREGTLGFLFLTDLRGYDVVSGKLIATSLRGFYALLAFLPILAITQMMGGVTGVQYWKTSLALLNALFCSLAVGMLISAISRDSQKAMSATLFLLLISALGGPAVDAMIAGAKGRGFQPLFSLSSPGYLLFAASAWGRSWYWTALVVNQLFSWTLFAMACVLVPHTWQERKIRQTGDRGWSYVFRYGGANRRTKLRQKLLDNDPISWLVCRERWQMLGIWGLVLLLAAAFLVVLRSALPMQVWIVWNYIGWIFILVLYVSAASQACRFLVETRRNGFLELLLSAPVTAKQIIVGQWRGSLRMFGLPVLFLIITGVAGTVLSQLSLHNLVSGAAVTTTVVTNQTSLATNQGSITTQVNSTTVTFTPGTGTNSIAAPGTPSVRVSGEQVVMALVTAIASALTTAGNLLALGWFGMWMGLTSRTANLATMKTLLFVQIIPWFVIAFGSTMLMGFIVASQFVVRQSSPQPNWWLLWWPLLSAVLSTGLALIKDVVFIVWSRKKLYATFREHAAMGSGQTELIPTSPRSAMMPLPPVIPAQS